jgi:YtkA-like protein
MSPSSILCPAAPLAALPCLLLLAACSSATATTGSQTSFPTTVLQTMACDTGDLNIELKTAPTQPLTTGLDGVELVLTDPKTGAPVDDMQIVLVPWMPLMGHGADLVPTFNPMGKGRYVFTNVNLFMPGEWQLRFAFTGAVNCSAAPTFNVP